MVKRNGDEVYAEPEVATALVLAGMSLDYLRCLKCINEENDERCLQGLYDARGV